jgi:hypothetical protein
VLFVVTNMNHTEKIRPVALWFAPRSIHTKHWLKTIKKYLYARCAENRSRFSSQVVLNQSIANHVAGLLIVIAAEVGEQLHLSIM